jgi:hypothetical protein
MSASISNVGTWADRRDLTDISDNVCSFQMGNVYDALSALLVVWGVFGEICVWRFVRSRGKSCACRFHGNGGMTPNSRRLVACLSAYTHPAVSCFLCFHWRWPSGCSAYRVARIGFACLVCSSRLTKHSRGEHWQLGQ